MKKVIALLVIGCLLLVMPGCNFNRGKNTSAPAVHQTVTTPATASPPVESVQQPANPTPDNNNDIIFTHTYTPGHNYRIQLPATWRGKYTVQESKNQVVLDMVTFYFYKPFYVNESPTSSKKVPAVCDPIFGIDVETEGQWQKEKQGPFGYGIELASRDGLVFLLYPSIVNDYQGQDAIEYEKMGEDAWLMIGKTFEFVDGN
jgi:hypothetical protein